MVAVPEDQCPQRPSRAKIDSMDAESPVAQVDVVDLPTEFGSAALLLDVREDDEWSRGHAAHALHIPMGEVPVRLAEVDPDADVFVICHAGGRSQRVAQFLQHNGYRPANVNGGMLAWAAAGRPVVTDTGAPGTV